MRKNPPTPQRKVCVSASEGPGETFEARTGGRTCPGLLLSLSGRVFCEHTHMPALHTYAHYPHVITGERKGRNHECPDGHGEGEIDARACEAG